MFDINSFNETIIDIYIIGRGFRVRRKSQGRLIVMVKIYRGATQMNLHKRIRTAVPREEEIPWKSIITCVKGLFESAELG